MKNYLIFGSAILAAVAIILLADFRWFAIVVLVFLGLYLLYSTRRRWTFKCWRLSCIKTGIALISLFSCAFWSSKLLQASEIIQNLFFYGIAATLIIAIPTAAIACATALFEEKK